MTFNKLNKNVLEKDILELYHLGIRRFQIYTIHNNFFAVDKEIRYKVYTRLLNLADKYDVIINLSMNNSTLLEDQYYYYENGVKVQEVGMLGNWNVVGWN